MTLTTFARRSDASRSDASRSEASRSDASAVTGATESAGADVHGTAPATSPRRPTKDADGLAVASFVLGLVGLLVMNLLLGPAAIVMAIAALARSTARRGRALLGLALGVADLVILAFLVTGNGVVAWDFGG